jgi:hypothetical protein
MTDETKPTFIGQPDPVPDTIRTPEFVERYGNNVRLESSAWDLKLLFGLLDQSRNPLVTNLHTTVNVPWMQAKLLVYWIYANVLLHERIQGTILIPPRLVPFPITDPIPEIAKDSRELLERLEHLRADLFGVKPVAPEDVNPIRSQGAKDQGTPEREGTL